MVKVKAATILETVIAMVIILAVFLTAGTILLNLSKSGVSEKNIRAYEAINNYYKQIQIKDIPYEDKQEEDGFLINATIENYNEKPGVAVVHCWINDINNNIIAEEKRIVLINN
ncbi:MAG: hypothetical protein JST86_00190 [Bacteroidetes bacterium]|nr:hypothetical protein [Bacteroidota bacterium]